LSKEHLFEYDLEIYEQLTLNIVRKSKFQKKIFQNVLSNKV